MAGAFRKSLVWLGLVEPDEEDELTDVVEPTTRTPHGSASLRQCARTRGSRAGATPAWTSQPRR